MKTMMGPGGVPSLEMMEDFLKWKPCCPIGGRVDFRHSYSHQRDKPQDTCSRHSGCSSCAYYVSRQKRSRPESNAPTVADGIGCSYPADNPYPIIDRYVDEIEIVEEEDIKESVRLVAHHAKLIAEPTSCVVIAALLSGRVKTRPDEKVACVLTSGNWDIDKIGMILKNEPFEGEIAT